MTQVFIKFKPDAFWISKNSTYSSIVDRVKYFYVNSLNKYQNHSLYFKYQKCGYCLIFLNDKAEDGQDCYKNLQLLIEKDDKKNPDFQMGKCFVTHRSDEHGVDSLLFGFGPELHLQLRDI
jgi:hypothetical protein